MIWRHPSKTLWLWDEYSIELCADKYELYRGRKFLGTYECLKAAKTCAYGGNGLRL